VFIGRRSLAEIAYFGWHLPRFSKRLMTPGWETYNHWRPDAWGESMFSNK